MNTLAKPKGFSSWPGTETSDKATKRSASSDVASNISTPPKKVRANSVEEDKIKIEDEDKVDLSFLINHAPRRPASNLLDRPPNIIRPDTPVLDVENVTQTLKEKYILSSSLKFGFHGLGNMGSGIVRNLLHSERSVIVCDRTPDKMAFQPASEVQYLLAHPAQQQSVPLPTEFGQYTTYSSKDTTHIYLCIHPLTLKEVDIAIHENIITVDGNRIEEGTDVWVTIKLRRKFYIPDRVTISWTVVNGLLNITGVKKENHELMLPEQGLLNTSSFPSPSLIFGPTGQTDTLQPANDT